MSDDMSREDLRETIEDLVRQFAYPTVKDGVPCLWHGGLSALEGAFAVLGWESPHPSQGDACQYPGCAEWATCGSVTVDGYQRTCGAHFGYQHAATGDGGARER